MDTEDEKLLHRLQAKAGQARQKLGEQQPRQLPVRRTKPTASDASGGLGCLTGSPVILQSGQLTRTCKHQDVVLEGAIDIELHLTYVSDQHYRGYFGYNRRFRYEQQLRQSEDAPNTWRLYLYNGREFDFTETSDGFNNLGDFPATLSRADEHTLVLDYFDEHPQETYREGNLVRVQDRNGNTLVLSHRADNALTRIESNSGTFIELDYNVNKRVESLKDHAGRTWHYRYDQHDNLTAIINPLGESESYQYRAIERADAPHNHLLETIHDATGHAWLEAEYDAEGRVIAYREGAERYRYHYVHNQLIEKTDVHDRTTVYSLDDYSLIYAITHPDGRYEREDYDPVARVAKITNGGHTYEEHYDARHRLVLVDHGFGETEEYAYSGDNPAPTSVTKDGQTSTHAYDDHDNLISTTTPDGATEYYAWDERGNLTGHTDGEGHTTAFAYDKQDQIIQVTDPAGHSHQFAYNAQGQQASHTDPLGQTETFEYDLLGRPTGHTNTLGQNLSLTYTTQGRVSQLVDPAGKSTEWRYNAQGQLTEQRRPGGHRQRYHYNDDGLIDAIQRADGSELHVAYNAQKRITELTAWPEPEAPDQNGQRQTYHYNDNGRLTEAHNGAHQLQQDYADQGKLSTSTQDGIDIDTWYNNGHGGDKLGGVALLGQSWHYQHDLAGQVASAQQGIHSLQQQHNANGQVSQRQYPNGLAEHYAYTDSGHLQDLSEQDDKLPPIHYQYNPLGLVSQKNGTEYQYDPLGQLSQTSERPYYHNAAGNPIDNGQSYDAQGRLQSDGQHQYRYDGRGNLVEKQHKETKAKTTYTWNLFDQLIQVNHTDAEGNTEQLQFEYDALNRRVKKSHTQNDQTTTRRYLYQGHNLVAILDENDQLLATLIHDQAIDTPLAITTYGHEPKPLTEAQQAVWDELGEADRNHLEKSQTERYYYYHRDHQGSITALTDEQGEIVGSFEYDAFGNITGHQKDVETHNPFAYTGREFDRPDLYYYRARYYDPTQRRFISPDPIGLLSGDFNFYRYVDNDPLNQVDPSGMYLPVITEILVALIKSISYVYEKISVASHAKESIDKSNNKKKNSGSSKPQSGALIKGKETSQKEEKTDISLILEEPDDPNRNNKSEWRIDMDNNWIGVDDIEITIKSADGSLTFTGKNSGGGKVSFSGVKSDVYKISGKQEGFTIEFFNNIISVNKEEKDQEIKIKRKLHLIEMYRIDRSSIFDIVTDPNADYGHWYAQFYSSVGKSKAGKPSESYGWWPTGSVDMIGTIVGVDGSLNRGMVNDPYHNSLKRDSKKLSSVFFPYVMGGKNAKAYQDCFRIHAKAFSTTVSDQWSWRSGKMGWHCQTFQKHIMLRCGLRESISSLGLDFWYGTL
jgi:RHS repeat-associated protein